MNINLKFQYDGRAYDFNAYMTDNFDYIERADNDVDDYITIDDEHIELQFIDHITNKMFTITIDLDDESGYDVYVYDAGNWSDVEGEYDIITDYELTINR